MALEIHNMAGHLIRRLNQISASVFQERMKAQGLTMTSVQFAAMNAVRAHPGMDQARLAGMIAYDRATIGGVVDRLESKGLLTRRVCEQDRRARLVSLTEAGEALLDELIPVVRSFQEDILSGLSEAERAEFLRLAAKAADGGNHLSRAPLILEKKS
ncbi:MarR family winged helix-turn-helix transcriptional regulator [Celeribacter neptunius]|uniref:DNA-binding transcriptional regulator, MarR family n=1 Tax=Celeribacter neptunius TaxID=588602 RepID=A0A1I3WC15_9RHOB|nr:MarR family transcriptional regulator [Celeribacter neptunius]SFK05002.1 DNA-binding transcriptional regulator, MarR family [Celeribacter neptunius]